MKNLLQASHSKQKEELIDLPKDVLSEISGGHSGGADDHYISECPDGSLHIDHYI